MKEYERIFIYETEEAKDSKLLLPANHTELRRKVRPLKVWEPLTESGREIS